MSNRLSMERSPYLLQHADNPVDWRPWGPEVFEAAKRTDKPIFLSIGYSTCHGSIPLISTKIRPQSHVLCGRILPKNMMRIRIPKEVKNKRGTP